MADADYQRLRAACHCGAPVKAFSGRGRPPKYCESHGWKGYVKTGKHKSLHVCVFCRKEFLGIKHAKYCSAHCSSKDRWAKSRVGKSDLRSLRSANLVCLQCNTSFVGFKTAKFCSRRCGWTFQNKMVSASLLPRPTGNCEVCSALFVQPTGPKKYCSPKCRSKAREMSRPIGGSTHIKRARKYGVEFHRFSKVEVFERDGWKCGICGIDTPKSERGARAHNSPELDHVVPLSRGGKHVMSNTRCACRSCNGTKGAMTDEELFLRLAA